MQCTVDECGKEAAYTFVWPWGAPGASCQDHVVVVQQKARAARGKYGAVSFSALDPDRPQEIRRDERIALQAARLAAEAERDEAKLRAQKLFEANTGVTNELKAARARIAQYEVQTRELLDQVQAVARERDQALIAATDAREEAERLGVRTPPASTPATPGAPGTGFEPPTSPELGGPSAAGLARALGGRPSPFEPPKR